MSHIMNAARCGRWAYCLYGAIERAPN